MNPVAYVIRVSSTQWIITPFTEHVVDLVPYARPVSRDSILPAIKNIDVSLVMSDDGAEVEWIEGKNVTAEMLEKMAHVE